jgi:transposase-like protein
LNLEEYKRRLESGNPVTIEELENELKVLIKEMIKTATQGELTTHLGYGKNEKSNTDNYRNGYSKKA